MSPIRRSLISKHLVVAIAVGMLQSCSPPEQWQQTASAIIADLEEASAIDSPEAMTPATVSVQDDLAFLGSSSGSELFWKILSGEIPYSTAAHNYLYHNARHTKSLQSLIKDAMAAHHDDGQRRAYAADLFQFVDSAERDVAFMMYAALYDPHSGVRRNLFYQLPADRLMSTHLEAIDDRLTDDSEWMYARIGCAWVLAASNDPRGSAWARMMLADPSNEEDKGYLTQVLKAGS